MFSREMPYLLETSSRSNPASSGSSSERKGIKLLAKSFNDDHFSEIGLDPIKIKSWNIL